MEKEPTNIVDLTEYRMTRADLPMRERIRAKRWQHIVEGRIEPNEEVFLAPESVPGNVIPFPGSAGEDDLG